jgi:HSP20 family protein
MMMPSIFGENIFDDSFWNTPWFDDRDFRKIDKKLYGRHAKNLMSTDIKEKDNGYELEMDLPGFKKDEIQAFVENGYLTISASKGLDQEEKEKDSGKFIRRERYAGSCQRSFYVGDIKQEDIKASFHHGILKLEIPKVDQKAVETSKRIAIEG